MRLPGAPNYVYSATVLSVYDGDTITVDAVLAPWRGVDHDFGFMLRRVSNRLLLQTKMRLAGCNAWEKTTEAGIAAANNLEQLLPAGAVVTLRSHRPLRPIPPDDYGNRWDADVTLPTGTDLVPYLIARQWAEAYTGRGPKPLPPWPRTVS